MKPIRRVAVLGAGTMGSRIAAHFANARIPSLLLDIVVPDAKVRDQAARNGVEAALKGKPGAFFVARIRRPDHHRQFRRRSRREFAIATGSSKPSPKNLAIKRALYDRVMAAPRARARSFPPTPAAFRCAQIAEGYPAEFREHFLGTHFFNPPRYLHLVEMIPGPATRPGDPGRSSRSSAICISARAWSRARTRRTSSPIASARFSAPPFSGSPSSTISRSKKSTR